MILFQTFSQPHEEIWLGKSNVVPHLARSLD